MTTTSPEQLQKLKLFLCWKLTEQIAFDYTFCRKENTTDQPVLFWIEPNNTAEQIRDTELDYIARKVEEKMTLTELTDYGCELVIQLEPFNNRSTPHWGRLASAHWQQRALAMTKMEGVEL